MNILNEDGYIVLNDIIEKNNQDFLENFLMSNNFEWYFYPSTSTDLTFKNINNCYEAPQFVHIFFDGLKEEKDKHNSLASSSQIFSKFPRSKFKSHIISSTVSN